MSRRARNGSARTATSTAEDDGADRQPGVERVERAAGARGRAQPATRTAVTRIGTLIPKAGPVEDDLGEQAERQAGEQDAARDETVTG